MSDDRAGAEAQPVAASATAPAEPSRAPAGRVQFRRELASLGYEAQVEVVRPHGSLPQLAAPVQASPAEPAVQYSGGTGGTWEDYVNGLPSELQAGARTIPTSLQEGFKGLSNSQKRTVTKLTEDRARSRYINSPDCRTAVDVIVINADHTDFYQKLFHSKAACRDKFEVITPDERTDLLKIKRVDAEKILEDPARMTEWNVGRVADELKKNLPLAAQLVTDIGDETKTKADLTGLCEGKAGERLRRVAADPGFEVEQTKVDFVTDVRNGMLSSGNPAWDVMQSLQPRYVLKGKPTTLDPAVEITKGLPLVSVIVYNAPTPALITRIMAVNTSDADYPKITRTNPDGSTSEVPDPAADTKWGTFPGALKTKFAMKYLSGGGAFSVGDMQSIRVTGRNDVAYWAYDPSVSGALLASYTLDEIKAKMAVEESPEYGAGVLIVDLKRPAAAALTAAAPQVRRPTALDGLTFDQFALANPTLTYGVTSGGSGEVIVSGVDVSQCDVKGIVR